MRETLRHCIRRLDPPVWLAVLLFTSPLDRSSGGKVLAMTCQTSMAAPNKVGGGHRVVFRCAVAARTCWPALGIAQATPP